MIQIKLPPESRAKIRFSDPRESNPEAASPVFGTPRRGFDLQVPYDHLNGYRLCAAAARLPGAINMATETT